MIPIVLSPKYNRQSHGMTQNTSSLNGSIYNNQTNTTTDIYNPQYNSTNQLAANNNNTGNQTTYYTNTLPYSQYQQSNRGDIIVSPTTNQQQTTTTTTTTTLLPNNNQHFDYDQYSNQPAQVVYQQQRQVLSNRPANYSTWLEQSKQKQHNKQKSRSQSNLSQTSGNQGGFFSTLGGTLGRKKKTATTTTTTTTITNTNNQQHHDASYSPARANNTSQKKTGAGGQGKENQENVVELTVEQVENEGKTAIDSNIMPRQLRLEAEDMSDNESRAIIDASSQQREDYQSLVRTLINWINDELNEQRIIVKSLEADLYDGQVLGRLVEKLGKTKLDVVEFTQNENLQKQKLRQVLETLNRILTSSDQSSKWIQIKWSVEGIHARNTIQIIHLLVTMIRHFRPPVKLPANVSVRVNVIMKQQSRNGTATGNSGDISVSQSMDEVLTEEYDEFGMKVEPRDAFDTLFEHAPDKLALVKRSLCNFVNKHLNKINLECFSQSYAKGNELDPNKFSDGLLLIFLMASLENYFVPFGNIFTQQADDILPPVPDSSPVIGIQTAVQHDNYVNTSPIHKLHNVNVAFQLMRDAEVDVSDRVRAEDIVNADLKSTLRVLYMIFSKYKNC